MRRFWQFSYGVPLPPPRPFPLWIKPQNFTSPTLNGAHQAISEPYLTKAWKKLHPSHPHFSLLHTPPCSAMKWHPYLINCESWNFAQETPFLCTWQWLNCTAMQFHSPCDEKKREQGRSCIPVQGEMKAISLWHHGPLLHSITSEGPLCALRPRGQVAQWDLPVKVGSCVFVFATDEGLFTNFLLRSPKDRKKLLWQSTSRWGCSKDQEKK